MSAKAVTSTIHGWTFEIDGQREKVIRIRYGAHFLIIPVSEGRKLSDQLHDLCDAHERQGNR